MLLFCGQSNVLPFLGHPVHILICLLYRWKFMYIKAVNKKYNMKFQQQPTSKLGPFMVTCCRTIRNTLKIVFSSLHCLKVFNINIKYYKSICSLFITDSIKTFYFYLWCCTKLQQIKMSTQLGEIPYIIGICRAGHSISLKISPN